MYKELCGANVEVLYDDRDASAGVKLNDADLIGIPARVVVSRKTIDAGKHEWKVRASGETRHVKNVFTELKK